MKTRSFVRNTNDFFATCERDEKGWCTSGPGGVQDAVSSHVYDSSRVTAEEKKVLTEAAKLSRTSKPSLQRVFATKPRWNKGDIIDLEATSFTGINLRSGKSAGKIGWKDSDEALAVIESPTRGLDVDYTRIGGKAAAVSPQEENETIVAGKYRVVGIRKVPIPGTRKDSGWGETRQYVLEEVTNNSLVYNAKPKPKKTSGRNLLRMDPSRTLTLRTAFAREVKKQFRRLKGQLYNLIVKDDAFGLTQKEVIHNFDPDQPRDDLGRWDDSSGNGSSQKEQRLEKLRDYAEASYERVNKQLRSGNVSSRTAEEVELLDRVFEREGQSLNGTETLYRGVGGSVAKRWFTDDSFKEGSVIEEAGYASTSVKASHARSFTDDVDAIMVITPERGVRAVDMRKHADAGEKEMLLPRGTRFRVDKVTRTGGLKGSDELPSMTVHVTALKTRLANNAEWAEIFNAFRLVKKEVIQNAFNPDQERDENGRWSTGGESGHSDSDKDRNWSDNDSFFNSLDAGQVSDGEHIVEPFVYHVKGGKAEIQKNLNASFDYNTGSYKITERVMPPENIVDRTYVHGTHVPLSMDELKPGEGYGKWGENEYNAIYLAQKEAISTSGNPGQETLWGSHTVTAKLQPDTKLAQTSKEIKEAWSKHPEMSKQEALEAEGYHGVAKLDKRGDVWELALFKNRLTKNYLVFNAPNQFKFETSEVLNAFCATGEGGGVDPSCSPGGSVVKMDPQSLTLRETGQDQKDVDELVSQIGDEGIHTPIMAFKDGSKTVVIDGHHRVLAARQKNIPVPTIVITREEYEAYKAEGYDDTKIKLAHARKIREERDVNNAFCPTGEGGGVDASCSPGGVSCKECSAVAIKEITGENVTDVSRTLSETIFAIEDAGYKRDVTPTREWRGKTVSQFAAEANYDAALVSVTAKPGEYDAHVMPMIKGRLSNLAGYGGELITTVFEFKKITTLNVFCPTGSGGGVDASCSPGGTSGKDRNSNIVTPEFRNWFGKSKVTDRNGSPKETAEARLQTQDGQPVVVYHGTAHGEFDEFRDDMIQNPDELYFGKGFYFTEDVAAAKVFAETQHSGATKPTVMSMYLAIQKPFDADNDKVDPRKLPERDRAILRSQIVQKVFASDGRSEAVEAGRDFDSGKQHFTYDELTKTYGVSKGSIRSVLEAEGHDGITVKSAEAGGEKGKNRFWIAFKSTQIKSTKNKGDWSSENPNTMNAFCPTGEGGGVDPSCSPGEGGGTTAWVSLGKTPQERAAARKKLLEGGKPSAPSKPVIEVTGEAALRSSARSLQLPAFLAKFAVDRLDGNVPKPHTMIEISKLDPSEFDNWSEVAKGESHGAGHGKIDAIAKSLKEGKPVTPLLVRGLASDKNFNSQVTDGHHRTAAYIKAGVTKAPVWYDSQTLTELWKQANPTKNEVIQPTTNAPNQFKFETSNAKLNVFCPTGEGGGVDASCSLGGGGSGGIGGIIQAVKSETGCSTSGGGFCRPVAVALWDKMGRPKDMTPYTVTVPDDPTSSDNWGAPDHVILYSERTGKIIDPTSEQWERSLPNTGEKKDYPYFRYKKLNEDEVGEIRTKYNLPTTNAPNQFKFESSDVKLKAFQSWLKKQLGSTVQGKSAEKLWEAYTREGFRKGAGRAFDDLNAAEKGASLGEKGDFDFYAGGKEQFLRSSFGRPETVEKVKLLASRSFSDLKNMTSDLATKLGRSLANGLVEGKNPRDVANDMFEDLDISYKRAEVIARTEIIRAHAEGQLNAFDEMGVEEIGVMVEWSTAGDDRVCEECAPMEGVILRVDEAHNMIPRHPNCRCSFIPANVGEDPKDQTRGKKDVEGAIGKSRDAAGQDEDDWGPNKLISKERPDSILTNLFDYRAALNAFNPDQPRDEEGQWTSIGGSGASTPQVGDTFSFGGVEHEVSGHGFAKKTGPNKGRLPVVLKGPGDSRVVKFADELTGGKAVTTVAPAPSEKPVKSDEAARKVTEDKDKGLKLSDKEAEAFETYISSDYTSVNSLLRTGKLPDYVRHPSVSKEYEANQLKRSKEAVAGVDSLIEKSAGLPQAVTTYRGVGGAFAEKLLSSKVGETHTDPGYMSTTFTQSSLKGWADYENQGKSNSVAELHLTVPKGTKGVNSSAMSALGKEGQITDKGEDEYLLGRGHSFRVDKVDNGKVYATLIPGKSKTNAEQLYNAWCPTGEGGGQDNSCSPNGGGGGSVPDANTLSHVKDLPGSTNPKLEEDGNGKQYVVKYNLGGNAGHLSNEVEADAVYRALGVKVPDSKIDNNGNKVSEFLIHTIPLAQAKTAYPPEVMDKIHENIAKDYVADALLGNWDVAGLGNDNILVKGFTASRIDNGGAMKYRAMGQLKSKDDWDGDVSKDLKSMRDPTKNPNTAAIYKNLTDDEIKGQIKDVLSKKDAVLAAITDPTNKAVMTDRLNNLAKMVDKPAAAVPTKAPTPAGPKPLPKTYGELEAGHTYVNSQGKEQTIAGVSKSGSNVVVDFKGGGQATIPAGKPFNFSPPAAPTPAPTAAPKSTPTPAYVPKSAPVSVTPTSSNPLHSGSGITGMLKGPTGDVKFTDLDLKKIEHFNPDGIKNGTLVIGKIHQNAAIKAAEQAKATGKHLQSEQVAYLKSILPPGTVIKTQHTTAKSITEKFGDVGTFTTTKGSPGEGATKVAPSLAKYLPSITSGGTTHLPDGPTYDQAAHQQWRQGLTNKEKEAVGSWKGSAGGGGGIRGSVASGSPDSKAKAFMSAITKSPPHEGVVYRGISGEYADKIAKQIEQTGVGGHWSDPAPHCTSLNASGGRKFANGQVLFRIASKTGRPIHKEDGFSSDGPKTESEVVGMPGTKYRIIGIHKNVTTKSDGSGHVKHLIDLAEE